MRQGMLLTSIGVVAGLFVSFGVMRLMSSLLFSVKAMDPAIYIACLADSRPRRSWRAIGETKMQIMSGTTA